MCGCWLGIDQGGAVNLVRKALAVSSKAEEIWLTFDTS
jgi:hypothetical protein